MNKQKFVFDHCYQNCVSGDEGEGELPVAGVECVMPDVGQDGQLAGIGAEAGGPNGLSEGKSSFLGSFTLAKFAAKLPKASTVVWPHWPMNATQINLCVVPPKMTKASTIIFETARAFSCCLKAPHLISRPEMNIYDITFSQCIQKVVISKVVNLAMST